jgi:hypothetical protein
MYSQLDSSTTGLVGQWHFDEGYVRWYLRLSVTLGAALSHNPELVIQPSRGSALAGHDALIRMITTYACPRTRSGTTAYNNGSGSGLHGTIMGSGVTWSSISSPARPPPTSQPTATPTQQPTTGAAMYRERERKKKKRKKKKKRDPVSRHASVRLPCLPSN